MQAPSTSMGIWSSASARRRSTKSALIGARRIQPCRILHHMFLQTSKGANPLSNTPRFTVSVKSSSMIAVPGSIARFDHFMVTRPLVVVAVKLFHSCQHLTMQVRLRYWCSTGLSLRCRLLKHSVQMLDVRVSRTPCFSAFNRAEISSISESTLNLLRSHRVQMTQICGVRWLGWNLLLAWTPRELRQPRRINQDLLTCNTD